MGCAFVTAFALVLLTIKYYPGKLPLDPGELGYIACSTGGTIFAFAVLALQIVLTAAYYLLKRLEEPRWIEEPVRQDPFDISSGPVIH